MEPGVDGRRRLAAPSARGFGGGTDICAPLERAIARLDEGPAQNSTKPLH